MESGSAAGSRWWREGRGDAAPSAPVRSAVAARVACARLLIVVSARHPAVWVAAVAAVVAVVVLGTLHQHVASLSLGAATLAGGLTGVAAIGAVDGHGWIAARLAWPLVGMVIGGVSGGGLVITVAAAVGLATAAGLVVALRRVLAPAADGASAALVGAALAALAAVGAGSACGDVRAALAAAATAGAGLTLLTRWCADGLGVLVAPLPWVLESRRLVASPTETGLRQRLLLAAMLSSLVAMVGGLFATPAVAGWVAVISGGWLIALALPPSCLDHAGGTDHRWARLERVGAFPATTMLGARAAVRGVAWHAAILAWPGCVTLALSAGEPERLRAATTVLGAVGVAAAMAAVVAGWGRGAVWGAGGGWRRAETALACGLGLAVLMLVGGLTRV